MVASGHKFLIFLQFRIVLPLVLLSAAFLRYNAISLAYLLCLLVTPLLRIPSRASMQGATGRFLRCMIPISLLPVLGHIIFHVTLVSTATKDKPYGDMFANCSSKERLVRQIGFQRLDHASKANILRLVVPDAIVFITSVVTLVMAQRVFKVDRLVSASTSQAPLLGTRLQAPGKNLLRMLVDFTQNALLMAAGVIVPSIFGVVYFLVFLTVLTLWGCYKSMGRTFGFVRIILLFYTGSHIILLHLYQFQFFQDALDPQDLVARVLGLTGVVKTDCDDVASILIHSHVRWSAFVNVGLLLALYWTLAYNLSIWRRRWRALRESQESITSFASDHQVVGGQTQNETGSMVFSGSFNEDDEPGETESRRSLTDRSRLMENTEHKEYGARKASRASAERRRSQQASSTSRYSGSDVDPQLLPANQASTSRLTREGSLKDSCQDLVKRKAWMSVIVLIMRQSYVLSLIAMMAWSITYHSWLTFALLLTACILWMMPDSRRACLRASPFVLIYAELLLLASYIFNMNLKELPSTAGTYKLAEVGLKRFTDPCLHLALQAFYTLFLVLTMRQYLSEVQNQRGDNEQGICMQQRSKISFLDKLTMLSYAFSISITLFAVPKDFQKTTYDSKTMVFLGHFLWILLCKYWIVFCTIIMAVIALQEVFIYKIIYMFFFLIFIFIFQVNFRLWRAINYVFWWLVIVYSMVVLIIIYTFQFEEFNKYWTSRIGISNKVLQDIGLVKYDTAGLFKNLLSPTCFLVIVILQLRYFHQPFLKLSDPDRFKDRNATNSTNGRSDDDTNPNAITEDEEEHPQQREAVEARPQSKSKWKGWLKKVIIKTFELWRRFTVFMWRVGEIHFFKVVVFVIMVVAVNDVSALTAVYVCLLAVLLPFFRLRTLFSHLTMLWTTIIILAKLIYQLRLVGTDIWHTECNKIQENGTSNSTDEDNAIWFGLEKVSDLEVSISHYLQMYLVVLILICVESIVRYHQKQYYNDPTVERPLKGIIFCKITRDDADTGLMPCLKFFCNYFFYKFGLECCWVMTAITVTVRCDSVALIYVSIMGILMVSSRKTVSRVWPVYKIFLAVMLALQFLITLGFPKGACIDYPWLQNSHISDNLKLWLFLPDYVEGLHGHFLIADLLQLLLVCLQASVFSIESDTGVMANYGGGDNKDIVEEVEANKPIPCKDFTIHQKSTIDFIKFLIFEHMFWVTMAIIFITGATRINIFSLIYVIAVFCFMWFGKEFFLKPLRSLLKMWNLLTGYCVFVLFCKTALQLVGCVYVGDLVDNGQCWLVQTFGVNCLLNRAHKPANVAAHCLVEKDDSGMAWDVVCLVFLLLQRRIYSSHYFRHVVDTIQAQNGLVSKGAELINRIMIREVNKQNELEKKVLVHIKEQMKALKKKQANLKKDFKEPEEHFQAIRAGDYYLFEDDVSSKLSPTKAPTSLDIGAEKSSSENPNPLQLINTAHDQDMETAVNTYDKAQQGAQHDAQSPTLEEVEAKEDEEAEPPTLGKLRTFVNFLCTLWFSIIDWIICKCNRLSRNYRLVAKKLSVDLVEEKRRIVSSKIPSLEESRTDVPHEPALSEEVRLDIEPSETAVSDQFHSLDELEKKDDEEMAAQSASNKDRPRRLLMAIGLLLASQSELLCYLLMILDQMIYGSLLSLPLPLMVFLWGMLSVPRPSKTFWVTVITYVEAIVVCKYLFQFGFFPWNDGGIHESPFYPPRIIGIERISHYASMDIALLLALFLHRSILRKYGLWRDSADISADFEDAQTEEKKEATETDSCKLGSEEPDKETTSKAGLAYVLGPFTKFFKQVTESSYNATTDVYAPMFFCDFILFLVLVFGFSSFGPAATTGDGDVATYIQDNKIPIPFLVMLILQFVFIVIDRALFLRKNVLGKFLFQICLVVAIHIWMFFLLPSITERSFFQNRAAQLWYFIKCIYFGLSAYQIRCGYPTRILGNFLTKSYGILNMILFKGFLAIPFLLELRALMDWMWTDSTLAIGNWLQMEDIYANIFVLKCWREIEKAYPQERSIKKSPVVKYISGGILLVVIIFIIWFPLVFFSFFNAVFISNPPTEASLTIGIGGYQPLFRTTALGQNIRTLTDAELNSLKSFYSRDRNAYSFISGYSASDITLVEFDGNSLSIWGINPPSQTKLSNDLQSNTALKMTVEVKFTREPDKSLPAELSNLFELDLQLEDNKPVRKKLAEIINGTVKEPVDVLLLFPRFLRLASQSKAVVVEQLVRSIGYSNITLQLEKTSVGSLNEWWNLNELLYEDSVFHLKPSGKQIGVPQAAFITFNDKKAPESLSFLSGYGIIGLYLSFVVLVGRLLRISTTNQYLTIMFRELPDVDKVLQLCLDLYLVREMKEFHLEEDLYAMLVFLYRSPDTMVKETRQTIRIGNIKKKKED